MNPSAPSATYMQIEQDDGTTSRKPSTSTISFSLEQPISPDSPGASARPSELDSSTDSESPSKEIDTQHHVLNPLGLYLAPSGSRGRGVFAPSDIPAGTIIEESPVLVLSRDEYAAVEKSVVGHYGFCWSNSGMAIGLGLGECDGMSSPCGCEHVDRSRFPSFSRECGDVSFPSRIKTRLCFLTSSHLHYILLSSSDTPSCAFFLDHLLGIPRTAAG